MSSLRRTLASRANGRRSQGPVTAVGKLHSSQNAIRHGLLAECLVLDDESPEAFQQLLTSHIERWKPIDEFELGLVEDMVAAAWRKQRAWAIESQLVNTVSARPDAPNTARERITSSVAILAEAPALPLIHRYESRLDRTYQRAMYNLMLVRAVLPNEPSPIPEQLPPA